MSASSIRPPGDLVNEVYSQTISSIVQLCLESGDDPSSLIEQVKHELQKMVAEMMAEDDALLERKRAELAPIRTRFDALFHELHPDKVCPPYASTLPVLPALRRYIDEHAKLKAEHEKLLEREPDIRRDERQLANELNEPSLQTDNGSFHSKQLVTQISLLSEHTAQLREEKAKRIAHLAETVRTLHEFEAAYGWKRPSSETMVGRLLALCPIELDQFTLTKESLELVDEEFSQISEEIRRAEARFEQSQKQLTSLMRKHQSLIPSEKVLAAATNKQCRISKLPDLIAEVDRYTEHAMEKLTSEILKARERIHSILNKLSIGDVTNDEKYAILYTNDFTDDVYFMHEELAQELEAQYELNRSMYEQIETWNELFLEFQEFERSASDPQRFHRRGYSALAEERTRKKLEASLRDCERRLLTHAEDFQIKNNGQPFVMSANGKHIDAYLQQRKEDYTKSKEREREATKAGHATTTMTTSGTMVGRTPLKSKQIFGSTPSVASKRADLPSNQRTPSTTSRRAGIPQLPTGKTPLHNSTMKTRAQLQTSKRHNTDQTPSTIVTPVKQRRIVEQMINHSTDNTSSHSLAVGHNTTATAFKSSMITTPSGKRPLIKRTIPTPSRLKN